MPIYDYRCDHSGHSFSAVQSFSEEALEKCPNCGKRPRRLFTAPAIVFKGSGWYKTDSRRSSERSEKSERSETKADSAKTESKSETKPDAKAEKPSPKNEAAS
jgi:putative FmdB family regulatory protein